MPLFMQKKGMKGSLFVVQRFRRISFHFDLKTARKVNFISLLGQGLLKYFRLPFI